MPKRIRKSSYRDATERADGPIVPRGETVDERLRSLMEHPLYSDPVNGRLRDHVGELYRRAYPGEARADATGRTEIAASAIEPEDVTPFDPSGGTVHVREHSRDGHHVSAYDRAAPGGGGNQGRELKVLSPVSNSTIRGRDAYGDGAYGARRERNGKRYDHAGVDIVSEAGQTVSAPVTGKVIGLIKPYRDDNRYAGIELEGLDGLRVRVFYVEPGLKVGDIVNAGDSMGASQNLGKRYPGITNHVHVEMRRFGELIDPTSIMRMQ